MRSLTYRRPVSGIERGYLNSATQGAHPTIHMVLQGIGALDADAVRGAVTTSCLTNPGLAVVRRGSSWVGVHRPPPVIVHREPLRKVNDVPAFRRELDVVAGPANRVG